MCSPKSPTNRRAHVGHQSVTASDDRDAILKVTIGGLSDEVLLSIFRHYLDASPRLWPRLVHICRSWRRIVFSSHRALHLRLFCTHGTPVLKIPDHWPALPIVVQYGGFAEDEDDIMAALMHSDRVSSIILTVTSSLLEKLSKIERPFFELENLALLSRDGEGLILPSAFRRGRRLRSLHSTGTALPTILQLLLSSRNLVDLQFHEVFDHWDIPPEALTHALSGMNQLRSFSLRLLPATRYYTSLTPKSRESVVLPVLTRLEFLGFSQYLEGLLAKVEAPCLRDIECTFSRFDKIPDLHLELSNLKEFIYQIEMRNSYRQAHIISSERTISLSLTQPGATATLKVELLCEALGAQLLSMAQVCAHLSASLLNVEDLRISAIRPPKWTDRLGNGLWTESIGLFQGVKWLHLDGEDLSNVLWGLQPLYLEFKTVQPPLHKIYVPGTRHAPLTENLMSFVASSWLSGHPIVVEYERLYDINELRGIGSQVVTIEMLPDDIILNIFYYYLCATPQLWPRLACVCRRWEQIVLTSPLGLRLQLYFTYGTPVLKTLDRWTALPIVLQYGGISYLDPPAPEDEDNIMAALEHSDRVSSIGLTVTSSLLEKLFAIERPFSELEDLVLLSRDREWLTLPSVFRWGPRLCALHVTRVAIPALPQLIFPSTSLVDLQLHEIPFVGYFSPDALTNALSEVTQLETLSLHFLSFPPRRDLLGLLSQSGELVVLPALTCLKYRGTSSYLDSFVARIDAPRLGVLDITFFSQPTMDASKLGRLIERIEMQASLSQADVQSSAHAISISFKEKASTSMLLQVRISCKQLDWQLSSMIQVCDQFSPFLFRVEDLGIDTTQSSSGQDDVGGEQWLRLIRAFGGAKDFRVAGEHVTDVLCALRPADGGHEPGTTALPSLRNLRIEEPMEMQGSSWDAVQLIVASRSLSGLPIQVNTLAYSCHICYAGFIEPQELTTHLAHEHAYRIACPYCSDFEWSPEYDYIFREHLRREHPEIARNYALISDSSFAFSLPFLVSRLVDPLSSLHAKDVVSPTIHGAGDSGADDILAWSGHGYAWSDPDDILWPPSSVEPSSLLASFPDDT